MPDWTKSMKQTYEYYIVDPGTWQDDKPLTTVKSCNINRDSESETLGSATIDITDSVGECYIRAYLITIQNGITEKHPLGTFLVQTPSSSFNGKIRNVSMDAYTPLLELKENQPPLGYYIPKEAFDLLTKMPNDWLTNYKKYYVKTNNGYNVVSGDSTPVWREKTYYKKRTIMDEAYKIVRDHLRAPVVSTSCDTDLHNNFVANTDDTWLSFVSDLISNAKYHLDLDELGRILFSPKQDTASLNPVWTYNDDNSSILTSDISMEHDLYGVPNIVEVIYSDDYVNYYSKAVNNDSNSPTSIVNRGREITRRVTNPDLGGTPTQWGLDDYAERLLKELSSVSYTITYTHGYCPVRLGDCVLINCKRAGLVNIKARVVSQQIKCTPGCQVTEKAIFTTKLWE